MKTFISILALALFLITGNVQAGPGLCRVDTASPTWTTGKDVPCSVDVNGNTRSKGVSEDIVIGVTKTETRFIYTHITLAAPTTTVVNNAPGLLHSIIVNKTTANGVITCYDNTAASGTVIAIITSPAVVLQNQLQLTYDVTLAIGLTCVTSGAAQDITIASR